MSAAILYTPSTDELAASANVVAYPIALLQQYFPLVLIVSRASRSTMDVAERFGHLWPPPAEAASMSTAAVALAGEVAGDEVWQKRVMAVRSPRPTGLRLLLKGAEHLAASAALPSSSSGVPQMLGLLLPFHSGSSGAAPAFQEPTSRPQSNSAVEAGDEQAERQRFIKELGVSLQGEPVEWGFAHPAEAKIAEMVHKSPEIAGRLLLTAFNEFKSEQPALAADLLRCTVEVSPDELSPWGYWLMTLGMEHTSVLVRDAAVAVLEHWSGEDAVAIIKYYAATEPEPWLKTYMHSVAGDLSAGG